MGMYNEVHKSCPKCYRRCTIQISQVVFGFGNFDLDDPESLAKELTHDQIKVLHSRVVNERFWCVDDLDRSRKGCGRSFMVKDYSSYDRLDLAKQLFSSHCPCCNYPLCGHDHDLPIEESV